MNETVLYNPKTTEQAADASNLNPDIRKPYGGTLIPYAASELDEATRAARILFCDSDVGLCGVLLVVMTREKGKIRKHPATYIDSGIR